MGLGRGRGANEAGAAAAKWAEESGPPTPDGVNAEDEKGGGREPPPLEGTARLSITDEEDEEDYSDEDSE